MKVYTDDERKARMSAAHAELTAAVEKIASSEDWRAFLDFARKLHTYSAQNRMWLFQQAMVRGWDDLGHVAGFRTWLTLGRYVRKGERGLQVLAPVRVKVTDDDGERWVVRGFKIEHVFATCQTDGDGDIPEQIRPTLLAGAGPVGVWDALAQIVRARGFTIVRTPLFPANGTTSFASRVVTVADRLGGAAATKTLAHELAHVLLHAEVDYHAERGRYEIEAESAAYLVCGELGLETDSYSFPYVGSWAAGDAKVVTATADRVLGCARGILEQLEQLEQVGSELVAA